jgi:hypothetical protein
MVFAPQIYELVRTDVLYLRNDVIFLYLLDCSEESVCGGEGEVVNICIDRVTSNDQYLYAIIFLYLF